MLENESVSRNVVESGTGAQVARVPSVTSLAKEIVESCEDFARHKRHARIFGLRSTQLAVAIEEEAQGLEGAKLQERTDEVTMILEKIRNRIQKWAGLNLAMRWWRRDDIEREIEELGQELDTTLQTFTIRNQISQKHDQDENRTSYIQDHAESRELLQQIFANQEELKKVAELHRAGENIAVEMMQEGHEQLREMRQLRTASGQLLINDGESRPATPTSRAPPSNRESASQRYLEIQRGLLNLHDLTGTPPTIKKLDGEIRREGDLAVAGGSYSDIWRGHWLGQREVALKALRNVKADDKRAQKHFIREIKIWSDLKNKHVLQFYGIVTDIGTQIHMVSPWLENGNVLEYVEKNPDANKIHLLRGASEGLSYLHSKDIVHGNIKCSNILVSSSREACVSDFSKARVLEDVTSTITYTMVMEEAVAPSALHDARSTHWLAPEVIEGGLPSKESDTYSFAMTILELITEKHPFIEFRTGMAVVRAMQNAPIKPKRPTGPAVERWLTDRLWALMGRCWGLPDVRPVMEEVVKELEMIMQPLSPLEMLTQILENKVRTNALRNLKGDSAQLMIDYLFATLLQSGPAAPGFWKHVLHTLRKLSETSVLYPRCYVLKGITVSRTIAGSGGFCDILQGSYNKQTLCLKAVRPFQTSEKEKMFKLYGKEAILWGQLHHPNIVPFYGVYYLDDTSGRRICLVSPWMTNGNLVQYLQANPHVNRKSFIYDIACGLEYLHGERIVHADLKGENILVSDSGRACITDFGLSTIWNDKTIPHMTASTMHGHTLRYLAPELMDDDVRASLASDVWAFGMVCYEIMIRRKPFYESNDFQTARKVMGGILPTRPRGNPEQDVDQIDDAMWDLMKSCWAKEPEDRPTCTQILQRPELAGFKNERREEDGDRAAHEQWRFQHAMSQGAEAEINMASVEKILNELLQL